MATPFDDPRFWEDAWVRHIETYLRAAPRGGYWLAAHFGCREMQVLEIAGGSCRDSRYLADRGGAVIGSDFDGKTLGYLARRLPASRLVLRQEDAFRLSLADKSVDLSFHNGFWVCFRGNDSIRALFREQARVTRRFLVAMVHNSENTGLVGDFARRATTDSVYRIRFFHRHELTAIVRASGVPIRSLALRRFGGPADRLLARRIKRCPNPILRLAPHLVPRLYALQPWRLTERIACIVELE